MKKTSRFPEDDRAVSPVIGVILMVAITVILAAVIGGFVLGLGGNLQQAPQAQISIDAADAGNSGDIVISHNGGDAIPASDLVVNVDGSPTDFETQHSGEFAVGESATFGTGGGEITVKVIHEPSESIIAERTLQA